MEPAFVGLRCVCLSFIDSSIGDMRRRCQRLYAAKGHHFEEGGRGE